MELDGGSIVTYPPQTHEPLRKNLRLYCLACLCRSTTILELTQPLSVPTFACFCDLLCKRSLCCQSNTKGPLCAELCNRPQCIQLFLFSDHMLVISPYLLSCINCADADMLLLAEALWLLAEVSYQVPVRVRGGSMNYK